MNDVESLHTCVPWRSKVFPYKHDSEAPWKRAADEKTFDLVCSQKVSLLSTSRGAKLDWKSWKVAFILQYLQMHTPFAVDPH